MILVSGNTCCAQMLLEVLLRGHLWAESELIGILEDVLPFPARIDFARVRFPLKVALVSGHGHLEQEEAHAYLKLNSLRNKIAHNLHAELGQDAVTTLLSSFGGRLNNMLGDADDNEAVMVSTDEHAAP